MRVTNFYAFAAGAVFALLTTGIGAAQQGQVVQNQGQSQVGGPGNGQGNGQGGSRWRGGGDFPAGGRGVLGTVTEVAADHYTIKTDAGDVYTVHYSVNTRMVKQAAGRVRGQGGQAGQGAAPRERGSGDADGQRPAPETIKPTDIKVGDIITAGGEMDTAGKSIGAIFVALVDPERAKQMREMQANYGKTWLAGRITAIDGTNITIEGMVDHAPHTITVDENTSFRERRDSITMADIHTGEQLRADGAMKDGAFRATQVVATEPQNRAISSGTNATTPQPKPQ
jgi:hypothetical protein